MADIFRAGDELLGPESKATHANGHALRKI